MMKWALLGGAALAVTATAARADDLAELKAQIEALQTRVSQLEAQPSTSMPSGYSLLAMRDGQGTYADLTPIKFGDRDREDQGITFSVAPVADAAPVAEVTVAGEIRTVLLYTDPVDDGDDSLDVAVRGRLNIRGRIDTAVGEVGGHIRLEASGGGNFRDYSEATRMPKAYGWWQFAPEWQLMAGYNDNTAALQTNYDWLVSSIPIATPGPSNINNEQFRLTFASGPLSFAISVEDPDNITTTQVVGNVLTCPGGVASDECETVDGDPTSHVVDLVASTTQDTSDIPNVQAYLMYSSDAFTAQIAGLLQDDDFGATDWAVGGGATIGIADAFTFLAAVVIGEGTSSYANNVGPGTQDDDFWAGSVGVIATLSEDTRLELGAGIEDYDLGGEATAFNGGIFWDPVSQVTVGAGATYTEFEFDDDEDTERLQVWFGTFLRFP